MAWEHYISRVSTFEMMSGRQSPARLIHTCCLSDATPDISGPTFCGDETMSSFNVFTAFSCLVTHSEEVRFGSGDPEDDDSLLRRKVAQ